MTPQESFIRRKFLESREPLRLFIDATRDGVVVPDFVRQGWGSRLVIDLLPDYPLEPSLDASGFAANLAFKGHTERCRFPWSAVWAVFPRNMNPGDRGLLLRDLVPQDILDAKLPEETALSGPPPSTWPTPKAKGPAKVSPERSAPRFAPQLRVIKGGKA